MLPLKLPGKYEGIVVEKSVVGKESGAMQLECECHMDTLDGVQLAEPVRTMAWLTIMKKDGTKNESTLKNLRKAWGWSGESLNELEAIDTSKMRVRFTVEMEDNLKGESVPKVQWINPMSSVRKASEADMSSFEARWLGGQAAAKAASTDCPI